MDRFKTRFVSGVALAGVLMACGGASSSASPASSDGTLSPFDGTWACTVNGQGQPVTLETYSHCTWLSSFAAGTEAADWLSCDDAISGKAATPTRCDAAVTMGTISVSADGNTLTISETGEDPPDAGATQTFNATCMRTAPSQVRCSSDGGVIRAAAEDASEGDDAGVTQPPPECTGNQDCGGCARCQSGRCYVCPIGDLGICTC
jgi:hypothetical protein